MPRTDLDEAIKEAYASCPSNEVILHTLELRHPSFVDENGKQTPVRVVRDNKNLMATIEDDSPIDAGLEVEFIAMAFELELPKIDTVPLPEISLQIDNVTRDLMPLLDEAVVSNEPIEVVYRPYLASDTSYPRQDPPLSMTLKGVEADNFRVTGRASIADLGNKAFPSITYSSDNFPTLTR